VWKSQTCCRPRSINTLLGLQYKQQEYSTTVLYCDVMSSTVRYVCYTLYCTVLLAGAQEHAAAEQTTETRVGQGGRARRML